MKTELVIFIGIPASGKTSFYKERFFPSHVYISLDQLKSRSAEDELLKFCLARNKRAVVDNTNVTADLRRKYIEAAHKAGFRVVGYCFMSKPAEARSRNAMRVGRAHVRDAAIADMYKELQGKKWQDLHELCWQKGINWNDLRTPEKRGVCVYRHKVIVEGRNGPVERRKYFVDENIPIFSSAEADAFWQELISYPLPSMKG